MDPASDGDATAHEPEEFDPESLGPETPTVRDHTVENLEMDTDEVDEVLLRTFWGAVIALNVAMAAIPLGLLVIYFRGNWQLGGLSIAIGCVGASAAVRFYRIFRADRRDGEEATS